MPTATCLCGELAYEFTGEPVAKAACHCIPCRKTSGTPASYNLIVPNDQFKVLRGSPKTFVRKGDSGKDLTYNSCSTCPSLLWVEADALAGVKIVKMGAIDDKDFMDKLGEPESEIYCKNMWAWEKGWESAKKAQEAT